MPSNTDRMKLQKWHRNYDVLAQTQRKPLLRASELFNQELNRFTSTHDSKSECQGSVAQAPIAGR